METVSFASLWLPILLTTVGTFVISALVWMALPWHKGDFKGLPDEGAVRKVLLETGVGKGQWRIPFCARMEDMKRPEFLGLFETGPVGVLLLERPAKFAMGGRLLKTFVFFLFVAFYVAYVLRQGIEAGDSFMRVFQMGATVSFAAHLFGLVPEAIWFSMSWRRVVTTGIDALLYSLVTGAVFAWLWPWA